MRIERIEDSKIKAKLTCWWPPASPGLRRLGECSNGEWDNQRWTLVAHPAPSLHQVVARRCQLLARVAASPRPMRRKGEEKESRFSRGERAVRAEEAGRRLSLLLLYWATNQLGPVKKATNQEYRLEIEEYRGSREAFRNFILFSCILM
jgi:hypothetical protein